MRAHHDNQHCQSESKLKIPKVDQSQKFSVWLGANRKSEKTLQQIIDKLAKQLQSNSFSPHVTVCTSLSRLTNNTFEILERLAKSHLPVTILPKRFNYQNTYHQSLFIELTNNDSLTSLNQSTTKQLKVKKGSPYYPHISLAYFQPVTQTQQLLCNSLDTELLRPIVFDCLTVWETSGKVHQWSCVKEFRVHD